MGSKSAQIARGRHRGAAKDAAAKASAPPSAPAADENAPPAQVDPPAPPEPSWLTLVQGEEAFLFHNPDGSPMLKISRAEGLIFASGMRLGAGGSVLYDIIQSVRRQAGVDAELAYAKGFGDGATSALQQRARNRG